MLKLNLKIEFIILRCNILSMIIDTKLIFKNYILFKLINL
jgi:hypothetical protein